jgi:cation diffusion facilitator family transporter
MKDAEVAEEAKGVKLALASYIILTIILIASFLFTNVLVLLAQSIDRLSDILISLFFLISIYLSRRPADSLHAFGYARVQNVAVLIVATILIFFLSSEIIRESIPRLSDPSIIDTSSLEIALAVTILSMVVIAVPSIVLLRRKGRGSSRAQLANLLLDEFSCGISLIAILLIYMGFPIADPLGSLVVGVALVITGILLLKENTAILIGKSPGNDYLKRLEEVAMSVEGVKGVHNLRAEYVGPATIHADLHIELSSDMAISEADRIAHEVQKRLADETGCQYCEVHAGPYGVH